MNSPAEIAKNYVGIGKGKVETPALKLFILGIMQVSLSASALSPIRRLRLPSAEALGNWWEPACSRPAWLWC